MGPAPGSASQVESYPESGLVDCLRVSGAQSTRTTPCQACRSPKPCRSIPLATRAFSLTSSRTTGLGMGVSR